MNEHAEVPGPTVDLRGAIIDDNLQSLIPWNVKQGCSGRVDAAPTEV